MTRRTSPLIFGLATLLVAVPSFAAAGHIELRRDDIIPIIVRDELSFKRTEAGDRFRGDVTDSRLFPYGTRIEGRVNRVEQKHGRDAGYMDIQFTSIILPDGTRASISATPISLNSNYVTRGGDGRWQAKKGYKKESVVLGTTAGGLILGSLIKKPFEGAIIGALAGILVAETDKDHIGDGNIVIPRDTKVGALLDRDVQINWNGSWNDRDNGDYGRDGYSRDGYDRYGYDRKGRYNAEYDQSRDGDRNRTRNDRDYDRDSASRDARIEIGRHLLEFRGSEQPYYSAGMWMVPLHAVADQIDASVSDDRDRGISIEMGRDEIVVEENSRDYSLNGRNGRLAAEVEVRDGVTYVPIQVFSLLKKNSVYVNGTKY